MKNAFFVIAFLLLNSILYPQVWSPPIRPIIPHNKNAKCTTKIVESSCCFNMVTLKCKAGKEWNGCTAGNTYTCPVTSGKVTTFVTCTQNSAGGSCKKHS